MSLVRTVLSKSTFLRASVLSVYVCMFILQLNLNFSTNYFTVMRFRAVFVPFSTGLEVLRSSQKVDVLIFYRVIMLICR